ncbi:hypothetical protein [uncultured Jatrophihabitans sp.]|uniref:hypothetical protein n=1 Tax=uncultured Jatrophihabitans sp. TaxID=1610747 RepID=UPI0035C96D89
MSSSTITTSSTALSATVVSLTRRGAALLVAVLACSVLLIGWGATSAHADPYPPNNPSSGILPTSLHRAPGTSTAGTTSSVANESTHRSSGLSSTGFQALTATGIAVVLLGAGAVFLGLGRRRRHG